VQDVRKKYTDLKEGRNVIHDDDDDDTTCRPSTSRTFVKQSTSRKADGGKQTCLSAALWFYIGNIHNIVPKELFARA
jgi:hypothetical protein